MNSPIRKVAAGCLLLCLALLVNVTYVQGFQADELNERSDNRRVLLDEYARERGPILVGDTPIARSTPTEGEFGYLRQYPEPRLYAHVTGYYSFVYGRSALERAQNDILSGSDDRLFVTRLVDLVTGEQPKGGSVSLTLNPAAQRAAYDALGNNKGAVVALDPTTGEVLAMVSKPSYNPNPLASHSVAEQQKAWQALLPANNEQNPALNRAIAQTLPPGSVFKLVSAAAALESGEYEPDTEIPGPATYDLPQSTSELGNYFDGACGPDGTTNLIEALRVSCNTAFAQLGNALGDDALRDQAERFGFNSQPLEQDGLNAATSVFPADPDAPQTAISAIGQFDVRATPLQTAMVTAAIANNGVLMRPYMVEEVRAPDLVQVLSRTEPQQLSRAVSPTTAEQLADMMVTVVEDGTGTNAQMSGMQVGGKTGTAQSAEERNPYAWFTSFAPADNPRVAVAVVIEEAPGVGRDEIAGGRLAAPIAREVMEAVLTS